MKPRVELQRILLDALDELDGGAHYMDVYKFIWKNHHAKLTSSGDEWFYRWQYELSHAASNLRKGPGRKLKNKDDGCPRARWELM